MSKLYGRLNGDRGKQVTKSSNRYLEAHLSTWNFGIKVEFNDNMVTVHKTGGSNDSSNKELIYEES